MKDPSESLSYLSHIHIQGQSKTPHQMLAEATGIENNTEFKYCDSRADRQPLPAHTNYQPCLWSLVLDLLYSSQLPQGLLSALGGQKNNGWTQPAPAAPT